MVPSPFLKWFDLGWTAGCRNVAEKEETAGQGGGGGGSGATRLPDSAV